MWLVCRLNCPAVYGMTTYNTTMLLKHQCISNNNHTVSPSNELLSFNRMCYISRAHFSDKRRKIVECNRRHCGADDHGGGQLVEENSTWFCRIWSAEQRWQWNWAFFKAACLRLVQNVCHLMRTWFHLLQKPDHFVPLKLNPVDMKTFVPGIWRHLFYYVTQ